jgi:hypothetical protein
VDEDARHAPRHSSRIRALNENDLVAVVDLSDLAVGTHVIGIAQDQITLPDAISLSELELRFIRVSTKGQVHEPGTIED